MNINETLGKRFSSPIIEIICKNTEQRNKVIEKLRLSKIIKNFLNTKEEESIMNNFVRFKLP